jgi:hypothetical protein
MAIQWIIRAHHSRSRTTAKFERLRSVERLAMRLPGDRSNQAQAAWRFRSPYYLIPVRALVACVVDWAIAAEDRPITPSTRRMRMLAGAIGVPGGCLGVTQ